MLTSADTEVIQNWSPSAAEPDSKTTSWKRFYVFDRVFDFPLSIRKPTRCLRIFSLPLAKDKTRNLITSFLTLHEHHERVMFILFVEYNDQVQTDTDTAEMVVGGYTCLKRGVMTPAYQDLCP